MEEKFEDKRFEAFYLEYRRRKQRTDKEVIDDLTECLNEDLEQEFDQDEFKIEPFAMKEEWHNVLFDADGHLILQKNENEKPDLILDHVDQVKIDSFSLENEIKNCRFDTNGNFIPTEEEEEENEEEEEEEAPEGEFAEIGFDMNIAVESLRKVISLMKKGETVYQTFLNYKEDQDAFSTLTEAVFELQCMGLTNVYNMKRKKLGEEYNKFLKEISDEN